MSSATSSYVLVHVTKVVLGCLGKYLKESGAKNILVESCVFSHTQGDAAPKISIISAGMEGIH